MGDRKPSVLFSCREPGGVGHVQAVAEAFRRDGRCEVVLAASGTALHLLRRSGAAPRAIASAGSGGIGSLMADVRALLADVRPAAVFASHSSEGVGIDEALLAAARVPTFLMQDFWGEVNLGLGTPASTYFVFDDAAAELTASRWGLTDLVVVGSPKHEAYRQLDIPALRDRTRAALGVSAHQTVIGFFGQSPALPGYTEVLDGFLAAVAQRRPTPALFIREHPTFGGAASKQHARIVSRYDVDLRHLPDGVHVEASLAACDIASTLFSLCGLDHAYLSGYSPHPIGSTLYLMTHPALRAFARSQMGMVSFPLVDRGIGTVVLEPSEVPAALDAATSSARAYHQAAQALAVPGAARRIVEAITGRIGV